MWQVFMKKQWVIPGRSEGIGGVIFRLSLWILTVIFLMFMTGGCGKKPAEAPTEPVEESAALSVENGKLVDAAGDVVQLRGMSTHGIMWFPQFCNANAFRSVKEAGGNVVRIAMYTDTENGYLADPEDNLLRVRQSIEDALALDLYVIVDWHILSDGDPMAHQSEAITFFDAVAKAYREEPRVLYEICNEPNHVSWEQIKNYAYAIVPVIRQYAPEAVILVGTPDYSSGLDRAMSDPLPMENLLYSYHYYAGEKLQCRALTDALRDKFPVFVSEWGIGKDYDGQLALKAGEEFGELMNREKVSWCAWSLCDKDEPYSALVPGRERLGGFAEEDLSETGKVYWKLMDGSK